jgi:uncharacterized protein involved in exopolysaccharide biosynthesis
VSVDTLTTSAGPSVGVFGALRRHWFVGLLPVILFVGLSVVLGLQREPRYTSSSELSVGRIYVNNPAGVSGVIEATQSLASVYSRAIRATSVRTDTARRLGETALASGDAISATPVPDSPLIRVTAESTSRARARALASAASASLAAYVKRQAESDQDTALLAAYERADERYRELVRVRRRLGREYEDDPTAKNRDKRNRADVTVSVAELRREALRGSYLTLSQGASSTPAVEEFSRATSATSDRARGMQILVFLGLVAGLASGVALALLRAHHKMRQPAGR